MNFRDFFVGAQRGVWRWKFGAWMLMVSGDFVVILLGNYVLKFLNEGVGVRCSCGVVLKFDNIFTSCSCNSMVILNKI